MWTPSAFAWHAQHLELLSFILRGRLSPCHGRCSKWSTSREVRGSPATIENCGCQLRAWQCAALRAPHCHFLRGMAQHLEHLSLICVARAARGAPPDRSAEVPRRLNTVDAATFAWQAPHSFGTSVSFCMAGAAPIEHLSVILRGRCSTRNTFREVRQLRLHLEHPPFHFAWQAQHLEHLSLILRGQAQHAEHLHRGPRKSGDD